MQKIKKIDTKDKKKFYGYLNLKLTGLICEESDWLANLSNSSALLGLLLDDINWAGFYLYKKGELVLGPFWGKPACTHIDIGKGVCGTAAATRQVQIVEDVNKFEGHIACDSASRSEIVLPIINEGELIGVLDIDSPITNRFDKQDGNYLEEFVDILNKYVSWEDIK
ncbi:GAF domain-containing protein [Senegalia massiliensis]|uniref:GAF domain-containing protein n=1 Tax=Senegalia massiliensis TaxID=1720316 RepID=UPI001031067C|nr:GAF domain-containing protein [Senegalia massiliensis]